ncbi:hypothetical protein J6590_023563 [Homalodisca vitripennis]|nr:hypothetical protein J6590_023563 [Homalodisca vitripennis]
MNYKDENIQWWLEERFSEYYFYNQRNRSNTDAGSEMTKTKQSDYEPVQAAREEATNKQKSFKTLILRCLDLLSRGTILHSKYLSYIQLKVQRPVAIYMSRPVQALPLYHSADFFRLLEARPLAAFATIHINNCVTSPTKALTTAMRGWKGEGIIDPSQETDATRRASLTQAHVTSDSIHGRSQSEGSKGFLIESFQVSGENTSAACLTLLVLGCQHEVPAKGVEASNCQSANYFEYSSTTFSLMKHSVFAQRWEVVGTTNFAAYSLAVRPAVFCTLLQVVSIRSNDSSIPQLVLDDTQDDYDVALPFRYESSDVTSSGLDPCLQTLSIVSRLFPNTDHYNRTIIVEVYFNEHEERTVGFLDLPHLFTTEYLKWYQWNARIYS